MVGGGGVGGSVLSVLLRSFLLLFLPDSVAPKSVTQCLVFPVQETTFLDK